MTLKPYKVIYSDINEKIAKSGRGDIKISYNGEAVKTSIINILSTKKGQRTMLPQFGASLQGFLFENITDSLADRLANQIKNEIEKWDNRVHLLSIEFQPDADNAQVNVKIFFRVKGPDTEILELTTRIN